MVKSFFKLLQSAAVACSLGWGTTSVSCVLFRRSAKSLLHFLTDLFSAAMKPCLLQNLAMSRLEGKRPAQWLAEQTQGYSGADLHELATEAARNSVLSMTSALATLR
jgi:hypothetical protein